MSKEFLHSFFDASPLGFAVFEIKTGKQGRVFRFSDVNSAFLKFAGLKRSGTLGKKPESVFSSEESNDWLTLFNSALAIDGCNSFEHFLKSADRCFLVNVFPTDDTHVVVSLTDITMQKKPKECGGINALKNNLLWDNNLFGVILADKNANYIDANDEASRMTGYSCEELKRMNVYSLLTKDEFETAHLHFEQLRITGRAYGEVAYITKSGEKRWWNILATKVSDDLYLGLHEDVTNRKIAEEQLRVEKEHHENVITNINDVLWEYEVDSRGNFVRSYISPVVDGVVGVPEGTIENDFEKYFNFIHPDDLQSVRNTLAERMFSEENKVYSHEFRIVTKDGSLKYMRSNGIMHIKPNGNHLAFGMTTDLTERVHSEREIIHLHELMKFVVENIKSSVSIHDTEMNYIFVSNRYYEDMRLTDRNIIGKNHYEVFPDLPLFLRDVHKRALEGETLTAENDKLVHADGSVDWANWKCMPWYKADGTIGGIINYIEVITKRKQAEEKLAKNQAELQAVYDNAPVMICVLDENRKVLYANPAFTSFSNVPEEELRAGKACGVFGCVNSKDNTFGCGFGKNCNDCSLLMALKDTLLTGKEHRDIERTLTLDRAGEQQEITLLGSTALIRFEETNNIMLCLTDITERKNAEEKLKASEKKYESLSTLLRLMTDNMQDMLWAKNLNKEYIFVNKSICKNLLNAKDTEEPIGKTDMYFAMRERNSKPDNPDWHNFGEICVDSDTITLEEMKPMQFDEYGNVKGKFLFLDVHKAPLFDDNGQLIGVVGSARDVSSAKQAEYQLRKLSQAVEQSPATVVITNTQGIIEYVNPKFTELTGYTLEEAIGQNPSVLKSGEQSDEFYKEIWETISSGKEWKGEFHNKKKNGEMYWETALISPIKNEKGEITHYLAVKEDSTEAKQRENNIRITRDTYESIFNSVSEAIYVLDESGNFVDVNRGAVMMYGYPREELIGKCPADVSAPGKNDLEAIGKVIKKVAETGVSQCFEFWGVRKNGEIFPKDVIINKGMYFGKEHIIATSRDITERKRMETTSTILYNISRSVHTSIYTDELLENVKMELSKLFDTSNFFVAKYNPEKETLKQIIFCDEYDNFEEWSVNKSISGQVVKLKRTVFLKGKEVDDFSRKHNLDVLGTNTACWLGVPLIIKNKVGGVMVIQHYTNSKAYVEGDVTLFEMVAHELGVFLEKQQIIEDLVKAKIKAEESDQLKSAFLANMSHEIRTPMNGILGFSSLLKEPNLTGEQYLEYVEIIEKSGRRMLNIINDIIDISKIESGLMELRLSKSNIIEQIEYIFTFFKPEAESKGLKLSIKNSIKGTELNVLTDREKLYAILTNLVKNAIKYTEKGEIEFGCNSKNGLIEFFVKDTGIGIPESRHLAIFERFVQADIEDKMANQGAGLGLAITKAYVEMMGGKIWVESKEGLGSVFIFTLPIETTMGFDDGLKKRYNDADSNTNFSKLKILIVEDDNVSELLLEKNLKSIAKTILKASTGVEAINVIKNNPDTDLILMDIRLPVLNGIEATRQIRQFNKEVIIIAQTAYGLVGDKEKVLEAGCNDYVAKPISSEELKSKVRNFFSY